MIGSNALNLTILLEYAKALRQRKQVIVKEAFIITKLVYRKGGLLLGNTNLRFISVPVCGFR